MSIPLEQFEQVCSHFYAARSTSEQKEAEKTLFQFAELPDVLEKCQYLLQHSQSPYSLHMAASTMRRHISSSKGDSIPSQQLTQIRQFLLVYLSTRPKQVNFVHQALLELVARLTRSCWFDSSRGTTNASRLSAEGERSSPPPLSTQTLVEELTPSLFNSMDPWKLTVGVQILVAICQEINSLNEDLVSGRIYSAVDGLDPQLGQRTLAQLRRVIYWCRDHELFEMFKLALRLARTYVEGVQNEHGVLTGLTALSISLPPRVVQRVSDEPQATLVVNALKLLATTISFDFTQNFSEEYSDDLVTVQLPSAWRTAIMDPDPLELFQDLYSYAVLSNTGDPSASISEIPHLVVSNLVLFSSIRRSLFTTSYERSKYISRLLNLAKTILTHPEPLSNSSTHLEFCRSLARLKSNFQLTELLRAGLPPPQQPSITLSGDEFNVTLPSELNESQNPARSPIYSDVLSLIADFSMSTLMQIQETGAATVSASQGRGRGKSGESNANSVYFLLSFWNRLVSSLTYLRNQEPVSGHHLEVFAPKVFEAYCRGRKAAIESASDRAPAATALADPNGGVPIDSGLDDPLEDHASLYQQMDFIATIGRYKYEQSSALIIELFQQAASLYEQLFVQVFNEPTSQTAQRALANPQLLDRELRRSYDLLAMFTYIMAALIGGRMNIVANDQHDLIDGELTARMLELMSFNDKHLSAWFAEGGSSEVGTSSLAFLPERQRSTLLFVAERLETAFIYFCDRFRRSFIGETPAKSPVFKPLERVLGSADEFSLLRFIVNKIVSNLRFWSSSSRVCSRSLFLLNDLSLGYNSVRQLIQLDSIIFVLFEHDPDGLKFLSMDAASLSPPKTSANKPRKLPANATSGDNLRFRSTFYTAIGRILLAEMSDLYDKFDQFFLPIHKRFVQIKAAFQELLTAAAGNPQVLQTPLAARVKLAVIALSRDLRGLAFAFPTRDPYRLLFETIHPEYTQLIARALEVWRDDARVCVPVLRLFCELAQNRSQRIQADAHSPIPYLIFRDISKVFCTFVSHLLTLNTTAAAKANPNDQSLFDLKIKCSTISLSMLRALLSGNYVNSAVLALFCDPTLAQMFDCSIKLILTFPPSLKEYPKLEPVVFQVLESIASSYMETYVAHLSSEVLVPLLTRVAAHMSNSDATISGCCCSTLDALLTHVYEQMHMAFAFPRSQLPSVGIGIYAHFVLPSALIQDRSAASTPHEPTALAKLLLSQPAIFQQMLQQMLHTVIYEDCHNLWNLSRPLLVLILLIPQAFEEARSSFLKQHGLGAPLVDTMSRSQPRVSPEQLAGAFDKLLVGVGGKSVPSTALPTPLVTSSGNGVADGGRGWPQHQSPTEEVRAADKTRASYGICVANRDRFSQNLSAFRREMSEMLATLRSGNGPNNQDSKSNHKLSTISSEMM